MSKLPIVAIDAREIVGQRAGKANTVYRLIKEWAKHQPAWQPLLYTEANFQPTNFNLPSWMKIRIIRGGRGRRFWWLANDIDRQGVALALHPTGHHVALASRTPYMLIVYDLVAFSQFAKSLPFKTRLAERLMLPRAARRAEHIFAISEFTKKELVRYLKLDPAKITVMPLAAGEEFRPATAADEKNLLDFTKRYQLPNQYLLFVGTLEPRKNIRGLLAAYHDLPAKTKQAYPLLLVGRAGWLAQPIEKMIEALGEQESIRHIPYVEAGDLPHFYQRASVLIYPSFYEGFGLPPLEALAAGCPVITSNAASLPEVVGEAALLVNPQNPEELSGAILKLLSDPKLQVRLRTTGLHQAKQFSWRTAAGIVNAEIVRFLKDRSLID